MQDSTGSHISPTNGASPMQELIGSNPSSFNSRSSGSSVHNSMTSWMSNDRFTAPSPKQSDSSKELVEAAEEEIEELHDEVKMWERHSRRLKLDLENLKKEISDKSKHQTNLDRQLSAAYSECDSLRLEVEQLKAALHKLTLKDSDVGVKKSEGMHYVQTELEDELKFQKDTNYDLTQQLRKTQESNIELVSILQELEEMIEKQRLEIADQSQKNHIDEDEQLKNKNSLDNQVEWERKLAQKEDQILMLEERLSNIVKNQGHNGSYSDYEIREIEVLKAKINDLERDCTELTDENLDLIFKLKELSKDTSKEPQNIEKKTKPNGINVDELQSQLLLREQERDRLQQSNWELEDLISTIQKEKSQVEEELVSVRKECIDTIKHLQDVEHDLEVLRGSMEFHSSADETLERRLAELERNKTELELYITQIEQENVELSEIVSGLEAQFRHVTNEKESVRLELEDTSSLTANLKNEVEHQTVEVEMKKAELKQKLQETENHLSEVLEGSDLLSQSNSKLQATIESLTEECSSLHKLTEKLKSQDLESHLQVTLLEIELDEKRYDFYKQVELLELKLASIQTGTESKEKSLLSQLDQILEEHKEHGERIAKALILLNKIELEKAIEVENLEKEISNLAAQKSSNFGDLEKIASDEVHEASVLRSDKAKLEWNLQEANSKIKLYETDLQNFRQESENKIAGLIDLLNASKQSEETLMADIEHIHQAIESVKYSEEKYINMENEGELNIKASQAVEVIPPSTVEVKKLIHLRNSILGLKNSFDDANSEKQKLVGLLKSLSEEYEELKGEKESLTERVANMLKAISNSEEDRHNRMVLEEKILRLENDLLLKEASCSQEAELKNKLNLLKQTNSEYERKIESLERENHELMNKIQTVEKELMLPRTSLRQEKEVNHGPEISTEAETQDVEANRKDQIQLKRAITEKQAGQLDIPDKNVNADFERIASLETELREMRERYLNVSLQYAQVEAQREELVMQLKSVKKEKRWFS
ncbi:interaptin-like isoform X2 [Zingiber officinale]|nr:interaptin-like isoform X2 [Zingiber officinale]